MKTSKDPRHQARVIAVQTLFSTNFMDIQRDLHTPSDLAQIDEIEEYDIDLYNQYIQGVKEKSSDIDALIVKYAPQWPIKQIKKVDLEILRIAILEGFLIKITPPKAAIDEAIELAKAFGGNTSDKFVSGVLGAIYENLAKENNG